ncbi:Nitroalkane oxidase [Cyphellophora attinorum]|uniref:Nitroalkane oxidase n=1 Tax=Cyphellophora attinorum TaxID=1664694 RepID=A0A0N0NMP5_9EURO|nr:Nitroalkane oxidase [Phialophora attinorum]KPI40449.1 Nitroalkane oxidase [Phialophora attinorum]
MAEPSSSLTTSQRASRDRVRALAKQHLTNARAIYSSTTTTVSQAHQIHDITTAKTDSKPKSSHSSFASTLPIYRRAVSAGLLRAQVPTPLGGTCDSLLDLSLMTEELYSVDTSASLTILGTGLGLTPLILAAAGAAKLDGEAGKGTMQLVQRFLRPFLEASGDGEGVEGAPLASLVFSEPQGSANFAAAESDGLQTVAVEDGEDFVLNGEKIWATNSSGWDDRGADLQCVVCRIPSASSPKATTNGTTTNGTSPTNNNRTQIAILLVTRADIARNPLSAYSILSHPSTLGHRAVNGPHQRFTNLRVPKSQLLAPPDGTGAALVEATFTGSAAIVAAMSVGIMRQAFSIALDWAKSDTRGSREKMIEKQSVADLLVGIKTKMEVTRAIARRAIVAFEKSEKVGSELCYHSKLYGAEAAVESVRDAMYAVGVGSYDRGKFGLAGLWEDVIVMPVFDGGNVGVRRRQVEALMKGEGYDGLED